MHAIGIHDFPVFLVAGILLNIAPGADSLFIVSRTLGEGRSAGVASALGIITGCMVYTLATAFGLTAVLAASPVAFTVIKFAGAVYLCYLGVRMILAPPLSMTAVSSAEVKRSWWRIFRQGMLTNLLNPKVGLFFLAFLPQFIDASHAESPLPYIVLGTTFNTTGTIWCFVLVSVASGARTFLLRRSRAVALVQRVAGATIAALGVRLALQKT